MAMDLFSMMTLLDGGDIAAIFNSPFVIPVAGCCMILGIAATRIWAGVRSQEIRSHERLARIAQGLPPEPEWEQDAARSVAAQAAQNASSFAAPPPGVARPHSRPNDGSGARRAGIILVSIGVGLFAFFAALATILQVRGVLTGGAAGLIPFAIGIGFLIDARLKKQEFDRYMHLPHLAGLNPAPAEMRIPPPPPPGMTPAQASDWRPSSTLKEL